MNFIFICNPIITVKTKIKLCVFDNVFFNMLSFFPFIFTRNALKSAVLFSDFCSFITQIKRFMWELTGFFSPTSSFSLKPLTWLWCLLWWLICRFQLDELTHFPCINNNHNCNICTYLIFYQLIVCWKSGSSKEKFLDRHERLGWQKTRRAEKERQAGRRKTWQTDQTRAA